MKSVTGKILRMRRKLILRDRIDIKHRHTVTFRYLFQTLAKSDDLLLILTPHTRNTRRTRDIRNVRHYNPGVGLFAKRFQYLLVVVSELIKRKAVSDILIPIPTVTRSGFIATPRSN